MGSPEVEAEGGPREDAHAVPHHGHLVQRGLPVEDDDVTVTHVALHLGAPRNPNLQSDPYGVTPKPHSRSHTGSHQNPIGGAIWGHPDTQTPQSDPYGVTPKPHSRSHTGSPQNPIAGAIWGHPDIQSDPYRDTPTYSHNHMETPKPKPTVRPI